MESQTQASDARITTAVRPLVSRDIPGTQSPRRGGPGPKYRNASTGSRQNTNGVLRARPEARIQRRLPSTILDHSLKYAMNYETRNVSLSHDLHLHLHRKP